MLKSEYELNDEHFLKMSLDEKRELLQTLFGGKDENGKSYGVYVKKQNDKKHP